MIRLTNERSSSIQKVPRKGQKSCKPQDTEKMVCDEDGDEDERKIETFGVSLYSYLFVQY